MSVEPSKSVKSRPYGLTLAGFDPSGGAGVLADCRAFEFFGIHGAAIITALTSQGPFKVSRVEPVSSDWIADSAKVLSDQTNVVAIKIGMLANADTVKSVVRALEYWKAIPVVLDPVLDASDGTPLIDAEGAAEMQRRLFEKTMVITPNAGEAARLCGRPVTNADEATAAGEQLLEMGVQAVVVKGGHLPGPPIDTLITGEGRWVFEGERLAGRVHGTGCAFSSAIAANLALGRELPEAVLEAKKYVAELFRRENGVRDR
jgi:hydroxymethylpyrimidine kinase/phosphomethylpyrimidine kinase